MTYLTHRTEGKRVITIAHTFDSEKGIVKYGATIWRRTENDKNWSRKASNRTALARLEKFPVTLYLTPKMPLNERVTEIRKSLFTEGVCGRRREKINGNIGNQNVFIGTKNIERANTTGMSNTFIGAFSNQSNSTGMSKVFIGQLSDTNSTLNQPNTLTYGIQTTERSGSDKVFIGYLAPEEEPYRHLKNAIIPEEEKEKPFSLFDSSDLLPIKLEEQGRYVYSDSRNTFTRRIFTTPFLKPEKCQEYIEAIDKWIVEQPMKSFGIRDHHFYNTTCGYKEMTEKFYDLFVKEHFKPLDDRCVMCTPRIAIAKYPTGERFSIHYDTPSPIYDLIGGYTCLIYLNDNFEGGETVFYTNDDREMCTIIPQQGTMLVFDIQLKHQGLEVKSGEKYWFGFEILISRTRG